MPSDLSYRLEMARRSLASTTRPDGSVELTKARVVDLLELLEAARDTAGELIRLRQRLLEVVNDPGHRTVTIPVHEVAAVLRSR